jgi:hypothetical protein
MKEKVTINVDYNDMPNGVKALGSMYDLIARAAGFNPDDVQSYDCRNIDISRNGQDLIYEKVGTEVSDPAQIAMGLAMRGPKVDDSLSPNTALIYREGIILKDGRDAMDILKKDAVEKPAPESLFTAKDCITGSTDENYYKRILVLNPDKLKDEYRDKKYQLWMPYANTFGCDPNKSGKAIYAVCLYDGDISTVNWRRDDFLGVLKSEKIPPFVAEKGYYDMFMKDRAFKDTVDRAADRAESHPILEGGQSYER